jgi:hypothetical protein
MPRGARPVASHSPRPPVPCRKSPLPRPARPRDSKDTKPTRPPAVFATGPRPRPVRSVHFSFIIEFYFFIYYSKVHYKFSQQKILG